MGNSPNQRATKLGMSTLKELAVIDSYGCCQGVGDQFKPVLYVHPLIPGLGRSFLPLPEGLIYELFEGEEEGVPDPVYCFSIKASNLSQTVTLYKTDGP